MKANNITYSKKINGDKFYTDPNVALECIQTLDLDSYDLIIEPSAGSWAFSRHLPRDKTYSFDLFPDEAYPETIKQDWLEFDIISFAKEHNANNVLIIGNPPYGRASGLASKFIQHSAIDNNLFDVKTTVAFVISEAFQKDSFMKRVPLTHTLTQHKSLGSPFTMDGEPYSKLNTGWFVYEPIPREKENIKTCSKWIKKHTKEEFLSLDDKKVALRTHGSGAGKLFWEDFEVLNPNTTRFLSGEGVVHLEKIDWEPIKKRSIGIPVIAMSEVFEEIDKIMQ